MTIKARGQRVWIVAALLIVSTVVSGCLPIWQGREMEEELAELRTRQAELEAEATEREQTLAEMIAGARSDIEELEEVLVDAREILSRDSANLGADVQRNREEMGQVRGELEELAFRFRRFEEAFDYFREDVDIRFSEEWPSDPEELLELGQGFLEDEDYRQARRAFERFLSRHESHRLANVARLELAELFFAQREWHRAVGEFQQLLRGGSTDAQQARAALRIGEAFMALGECEEASIFLETVVEDYPRSEDVTDARSRLADIQANRCP